MDVVIAFQLTKRPLHHLPLTSFLVNSLFLQKQKQKETEKHELSISPSFSLKKAHIFTQSSFGIVFFSFFFFKF